MNASSGTGAGEGARRVAPARSLLLPAVVVALAGLASPATLAQVIEDLPAVDLLERARPRQNDGPRFRVGQIDLVYAESAVGESFGSRAGYPDLDEFQTVEFELLQTGDGFVAPRRGLPTVTLTIADINAQPARTFYASALVEVAEAIRGEFNNRGLIGVFVFPEEIDLTAGGDQREPGDEQLTYRILTARVGEVRTTASGERIADERRVNHPAHARIRDRSPVQAGEGGETNLLDRGQLDRYVLYLNRHPGRRVDVAVSPGDAEGEAILNYIVQEAKPWTVYFQLSNTGTESTNEWRERFGYQHYQLTGNDDILQLDYITAGFEDTHALLASYEFPIADRTRARAYGSWNEYRASDVGLADEDFEGEGWSIGADLIHNVYQRRELFVDVFGGLRVEDVEVDNLAVNTSGEGTFWVPHIGVEVDRFTEISAFNATVGLEYAIAEEDEDELVGLGRSNVDDQWLALTWNASWGFYLDPLIHGDSWLDPSTPETSTLAHELVLGLRGQYAFDSRLPPQFQNVVGGAATVRGYDESILAADSVVIGTLEYRFHVPRVLPIEEEPRYRLFGEPFKYAPQTVYGRPDWDLVLSAFVDVARASQSDRLSFEENETLVGIGVGAELQVRRNLVVSLDWGFAMTEVADTHRGDSELHFILTLLY